MNNMPIEYCSIDDVKNISRVTHKKLGLDKERDKDKLDTILLEWIREASALINDYTKNPLTTEEAEAQDTKYYVYKNLASRIVANMCALSAAYKSHSVVKVNDWTINTVPSRIFPVEMKAELNNFKEETDLSGASVYILTATGKELLY